jgi:CRISPR-associated protein Cas2
MLSEWWLEAFPQVPYNRAPPGSHEMLSLVGYDISEPKRLSRVARVCEDFGVRVQYSIFECHLDEKRFEHFWERLLAEINPEEDRLVAYQIDARSARRTRTAGTMVCTEKVVVYLV